MDNREKMSFARGKLLELSDELSKLANLLTELEEPADGTDGVINGFAAAHRIMQNGDWLKAGQLIHLTMRDNTVTKWRVIDGCDGKKAVIQMIEVTAYRPFSLPDKKCPWGYNDYSKSAVREWLNTEFLDNIRGDDLNCIIPRDDLGDDIWLLSAEEIGGEEPEKAFTYYSCDDADELEERRQLKDTDGDPANWWLRTPYAGNALSVRSVYPDGALSGGGSAYYAGGVAPACIIE